MAVAYRMLVLPALMALVLYLLLALHHWVSLDRGGSRAQEGHGRRES
jgi:hypothetical protein